MQPQIRAFVDRAVTFTDCPECDGTRLNEAARSSLIGKVSIADACAMQVTDLAKWVHGLDDASVAPLLATLKQTLDSFVEIGLGYLSLDRSTGTLSGGESQRVKMIRHVGSSPLTDVTYVFDEPTAGLHPHDVRRMNDMLLQLRDKGNTVLVVEHEPETIAIADHVVDLGPGAGAAGGAVCFEGTVEGLRSSGTVTGRHFDDRATLKEPVRTPNGTLAIRGATTHNLRNVDVDIPLGVLVVVTGVAGSGKSSLVAAPSPQAQAWSRSTKAPSRFATEQPGDLHRAARSDPQGVRQGQRREAGALQRQLRGCLSRVQRSGRHLHRPGHDGGHRHHMRGVRRQAFREPQVLEHHLGGRDISEVLAMSVIEAEVFFGADGGASTPAAHAILLRLAEVGLGYVSLGQPLTTLSGGERQRLKLATHMGEKGGLYVLDEPTTACTWPTWSGCSQCWTDWSTRASRSS